MEITDRDDLGSALWAPQFDGGGNEFWSYSLLTFVQPGDRVFHWHKHQAGVPAIVGWSVAGGPISVEEKAWQAHGTRGRARGGATVGPAWVVPLDGFTALPQPITRGELNDMYGAVVEVLELVTAAAAGPAYLPFQNYGGRELRAQQGYLTKFPLALVALLFASGPSSTSATAVSNLARIPRSQGYLSDAEKRAALERHSLDIAIDLYQRAGATFIEERGKPFDLVVVLYGIERHVEVKGSTGVELLAVQLTQGEVLHARSWAPTDLVVVDAISCWRDAEGTVRTAGGHPRVWCDWSPVPRDLTPTHLRYELPL